MVINEVLEEQERIKAVIQNKIKEIELKIVRTKVVEVENAV